MQGSGGERAGSLGVRTLWALDLYPSALPRALWARGKLLPPLGTLLLPPGAPSNAGKERGGEGRRRYTSRRNQQPSSLLLPAGETEAESGKRPAGKAARTPGFRAPAAALRPPGRSGAAGGLAGRPAAAHPGADTSRLPRGLSAAASAGLRVPWPAGPRSHPGPQPPRQPAARAARAARATPPSGREPRAGRRPASLPVTPRAAQPREGPGGSFASRAGRTCWAALPGPPG